MEFLGVLLRRAIALALLGDHMDHHRPLQGPSLPQEVDHLGDVVAADGPEIGEPHLLEEGILKHEPLYPVLEALYVFGHAAAHHAPFQHPDHEPLQTVVFAAGP